jgi:acyl dehydratase
VSATAGVRVPLGELASLVGASLPPTDWIQVTQTEIDALALAVGDRQWIHVDPERAAHGPFGATIAHGVLTLGLVFRLWFETVAVEGAGAAVNYGFDRVRFPAPVRAGDRVRGIFSVSDVRDEPRGVRVSFNARIESETETKPVCVADAVLMFLRRS